MGDVHKGYGNGDGKPGNTPSLLQTYQWQYSGRNKHCHYENDLSQLQQVGTRQGFSETESEYKQLLQARLGHQ